MLYPNYHIVQKGWAERRREGLRSWRVAAQSCDGACYIYVKDRKDQELMLQISYLEGKGLVKKETVENQRLWIKRHIVFLTPEGMDYLEGNGPDIVGVG